MVKVSPKYWRILENDNASDPGPADCAKRLQYKNMQNKCSDMLPSKSSFSFFEGASDDCGNVMVGDLGDLGCNKGRELR